MKNSISHGMRLGQKISKGFREWLKGKCVNCAKSVMQIFAESLKSLKSLMQIFATYATYASANFVGKTSCKSTVMYRVKSRITSTCLRLSIGSNLSRFSLVSLICLLMLTLGVGNAWGYKMTYTFNTNSWGTTGQGDWTSGAAGNGFTDNQGVQITTGKSGANATSPRSFTSITKIEVQYCTNASSGAGAVKVQVGSGTEKSFSVTKPSSGGTTLKTATFNFSPAETGSVKVTGTCTANSVFIYSVAITYSTEVSGEEYTLLTDPSDLSIGDTIVIVESKDNYALSTTQNTNNRGQTKDGWCFTSPTTIRVSSATYIQKLILGQTNSHWTFYTGSGYLYAASSSSNYLKTQATNNANGEWTISIGGSSPYNATITAQGTNTHNIIQYNALFSCYASSNLQQPVRVFWHPRPKNVTWVVNEEETTAGSPTTKVKSGEKVTTLPTTPSVPSSCSSKVFVGWTDEEYDEDDDPPSVLFTTAAGAPTVDDDVTYYAVFATSSGGGSSHYEKVTSTGDITNDGKYLIVYESSSTSAIIFDGSLNPLDASPDTIMAPISTNTISATSHVKASEFTIDMTNKYIKSASNKYIYRSEYNNGMNESTTANAVTSISISSNKFIVKGNEGTGANSGKFTTLSYNTAAAGASTYGSRFRFYKTPSTDIYLYKYVAGASYSAYATTCVAACAEPTAASAGSFNSGTQKMPISWTSAAGEVDICYSSSSTPPGGTPGEGYTVIEGQTGSTSTSNTYNIDVSGLSAGNYYCWVRSVCDEDSKSLWTAITGDYFTIPGYTLTISPDPASSGTFDQTSGQTVVVGRTVSITATPAAGYNFTSWAVSGTGSSLSSTSTNPTTFTMGTANATVTATFTAKEVTGWTWKQQSTGETEITIPDVVDLYVGQQAWFNLKSYTPADVIAGKKGYSSSYTNTYLAEDNKAGTYYKTRAKAVTESTTLTLTSSSNSSVTQEITIRIKALPSVTFTDIIHGESFGAVTATVDATDKRVVYTTKKTPTHDDLDEPGSGNDCEKQHLHLAGWILKDWADLHPDATSSEISGAGSENFYSTNADIDLVAKNGKTFYAVWSKLE